MEFNGFEVFPLGNATLSISDAGLTVKGISDSGLDGVMVKANGDGKCTINFDPLPNLVKNNGVINYTALAKNPFGVVVPVSQSSKWYNKATDMVVFGYNARLMANDFVVTGALAGRSVFRIKNGDLTTSPDPDYPDVTPSGFIWVPVIVAAIALGGVIFTTLHSKHTVTRTIVRDGSGRIVSDTTTTTDDPVPFDVVVNGKTYKVDDVGVEYTNTYPSQLVGKKSMDMTVIAQQITGVNLSSFVIKSITA